MIELITQEQRAQLLANGVLSHKDEGYDPWPVLKLFTPDAAATWLLCHLEPDDGTGEPAIAWGLCDLGLGFPEMGTVTLHEIGELRGALGLPVERDLHFTAKQPVSAYAEDAWRAGAIVTR